MAGRRRKWLVAVALVAIVAALVWVSLGRGGKMEVQLVFVGYTNKVEKIPAPAPSGEQFPFSFHSLEALVLATNSGTVAVEISAGVRQPNFVITGTTMKMREGFVAPGGPVPSRVLKPGETMLIPMSTADFTEPWSTEIYVQRRGLTDRIHGKAWNSGNATVQGWMSRWLPALPEMCAKLGPITNPPPDVNPSTTDLWKIIRSVAEPEPLPDIESVLDSTKPLPQRRPSPSLLDGGIYR